MPIDPDISLHVIPPGGNRPDLLGMVSTYADIQNKLNENRLFQQTFAARQRLGMIFQSSPSPDVAFQRAQQDPQVAGFAGEFLAQQAGVYKALTDAQAVEQGMSSSALQALFKTMPRTLLDYKQFDQLSKAQLAGLPDGQAKTNAMKAFAGIKESLMNGIDPNGDDAANQDRWNQNAVSLMAANGVSADDIRNANGYYGTIDLGGNIAQTHVGAGGGSLTPMTRVPGADVFGKTLAPQVAQVPGPSGSTYSEIVGGALGQNGVSVPTPEGPSRSPTLQAAQNIAAQGKAAENTITFLNKVGEQAPNQIATINNLQNALTKASTGGGKDLRVGVATLAQFVQGVFGKEGPLGVSDDEINKIAGGSLADSQFYQTEIRQLMTRLLSTDAAGQGQVLSPEVNHYMNTADFTKDPKALWQLLEYTKKNIQLNVDKYAHLNDFLQTGQNPSGFNAWYQQHFGGKPKVTQWGGDEPIYSLKPRDVSEAYGQAPEGKKGSRQSAVGDIVTSPSTGKKYRRIEAPPYFEEVK